MSPPRPAPRRYGIALCLVGLLAAYALIRRSGPRTGPDDAAGMAHLRKLYIQTMRDTLTGAALHTPAVIAGIFNVSEGIPEKPFEAERRAVGQDWPRYGLSMIGTARMDSLWSLVEDVLDRGVAGSIVECGVWRGGASVFAKAVLTAHGVRDRDVVLVDSFKGLPRASTPEDDDKWSAMTYLEVSQAEVRSAFQRFGLLDSRVKFHQGYFVTSLPTWRAADDSPIAVLRMDGDMYESTMDQLYNLWNAISVGGHIIIDDYSIAPCKKAVLEFMKRHGLTYPIIDIDKTGAYFTKSDDTYVDPGWYVAWNATRRTDA